MRFNPFDSAEFFLCFVVVDYGRRPEFHRFDISPVRGITVKEEKVECRGFNAAMRMNDPFMPG